MRLPPNPLRRLAVSYSKADLLAVSVIACVVALWATAAGERSTLLTLLACEAAFFSFYLAGSLFAGLRTWSEGVLFELPLRLLVGYAVVNTALLGLAWLSPLGVLANFGLLFGLLAAAWFAAKTRKRVPAGSASLAVVLLCLVATTLWCQDSIRPRVEEGGVVLFKPWVDGFYHAVHVRIFGASHGAASIEDWRLAGVPARPYHYGMYLLPAFVKQASGLDAYGAFAGILAPVGVMFTGLAAYSFFGSLWGAWPGVAAAAALLLLPDGAQQGLQNPFMSYHFLTQISPSATYGLALLAVGWLFVIQGCTRGSRSQVLLGWALSALVVAYKLHYVVASSLLLLLVPAVFFRARLGVRRRATWIVAACAAYLAALSLGQRVPGVPLIRFDGSSVGEILRLILTFAERGPFRDYLEQHLGAKLPLASNLLYGIPYVLLAILGFFLPLLLVLVLWLRRRTPLLYWVFPLLLVLNFVLMFFGLALDFSSSTPDELSHRPLMIVYFFVAAWCGGALGLCLLEARRLTRLPRRAGVGLLALLALVLLAAFPARLGAGVQRMWAMPQLSPVRLPRSVVEIAGYLREHGSSEEVFQDSQFDRIYALSALSERRTFVAHTLTRVPYRADLVQSRTAAVERFMRVRKPKAIAATARAFGIRWFLLQRGDTLHWPAEIADAPALATGPFKLYRF